MEPIQLKQIAMESLVTLGTVKKILDSRLSAHYDSAPEDNALMAWVEGMILAIRDSVEASEDRLSGVLTDTEMEWK